jgi:nicotinate dehydrogenase subunit B
MGPKSASLAGNPRLSQWVAHLPDGRFELRLGKVELGQGILTALKQIALSELRVSEESVVLAAQSTDVVPNEGLTAGSLSIVNTGDAVRRVCAQVRRMFVAAAAAVSGIPYSALVVQNGAILDGAGRVVATYRALRDHVDMDVDVVDADDREQDGAGGAEGLPLLRLDLPDKVFGRPTFIQDMSFSDVLHARVIRPPVHEARLGAGAEAALARVSSSVRVYRDGSFVALLADAEEEVYLEAARMAAMLPWDVRAQMPPNSVGLSTWMREQPAEATVLEEVTSGPRRNSRQQFRRTYFRPYIAHASIAPSCALAQWVHGRLAVWTHSQSIFHLRAALAQALELDVSAIVVHHVQSAGCYGHNGADDAAFDAALLAMHAAGRPVRVLWSRQDELGAAPVGSAMTADIAAWVDAGGAVSDWSYEVWSNGFLGRPGFSGSPAFLGDSHRAGREPLPPSGDPRAEAGYGIGRNAVPAYELDGMRIKQHRLLTMPIRTSALRCLGAHFNVFAIESFIDEMAVAGGFDPVAFRLAKLSDERAKHVIGRAAELAGWGERRTEDGFGRGIAYARYKNVSAYCAVVAEVEAAEDLRVRRLIVVVDAGRVVNLDGVLNQVQGGALQAVSWTLKEEVKFDSSGITSLDWEQYPILRFSQVPAVEASVIDRPQEPSLGVGECVNGPVTAAIANALHNALGVRVRDLPLNNDNIVRAISASPD